MFDFLLEIYFEIRETFAEGNFRDLLCKRVFLNRVAIPACMELSTLNISPDSARNANYKFLELTQEDVRKGKWSFAVHSRALKASRNLKKGFRCFAVLEGPVVVGDLWCTGSGNSGKIVSHPDLGMLGVKCEENEAYAFDMLIEPSRRGKNLAMPLQRFLHSVLKAEGIRKVYGFYWEDNIPALWMHRMLKFKEFPKKRVIRFFFLLNSKADQ